MSRRSPQGVPSGLFPTYSGVGDPNGVQTATALYQTYVDSSTGDLWIYNGTVPGNTGWVDQATGSGGYASLTGPGQSTTPGDLTQAGGFTVNDSVGDGITLNTAGFLIAASVETDASASGSYYVTATTAIVLTCGSASIAVGSAGTQSVIGGAVTVDDTLGGGFLYSAGGTIGGATFNCGSSGFTVTTTGTGSVNISTSNSGQIFLTSFGGVLISGAGGYGVQVGTGGDKVGFFGTIPTTQPASGGTLAGVIAGLVALGLFSS